MTWLRTCLVLATLLIARPAWADDDDQKPGKGKGKAEAKPAVVQIDLSKLPPDLAKQLMKYLGGVQKPEKGPLPKTAASQPKTPPPVAAKGPPPGKGKPPSVQLPPGLAKKPKDHPGVIAFLKKTAAKPATPASPSKKKNKDDDD